jgi:hypothetical protein
VLIGQYIPHADIFFAAVFCKEHRPQVRRAHPEASIPEQAMVLSEMWRGLSERDKNVFKSMVA